MYCIVHCVAGDGIHKLTFDLESEIVCQVPALVVASQ